MTITYISGSSNYTNAAGDQIVVTAPASIADNDLLIYSATAQGGPLASAWDVPSGFTEIDSNNYVAGRDLSHAIGYKVASSESGDYTLQILDATSGIDRSAGIIVLRGIDISTPIDVTYVQGTHYTEQQNDPTPTPSAITTVTDGAWVIITSGVTTSALTTGVAPSGYTLRIDEKQIANLHLATKEVANAGAETPAAWGHTGGSAGAESATFTIAIRPAAASAAVSAAYYEEHLESR